MLPLSLQVDVMELFVHSKCTLHVEWGMIACRNYISKICMPEANTENWEISFELLGDQQQDSACIPGH